MIALPNWAPLFRVLERVLVGGAGDPERLGADRRPARLEGLHRRLRFRFLALADAGEAFVELLFAAEQAGARDAAVVEEDVGGVRGPQAVLFHLGALLAARGARRDHEGGVAARAELAIDRGDHHVDVGDAAVGRPGLLAVQHPLVLGLVVLGVVRIADTSEPASGSDAQNAPSLTSSGVPKHWGIHSPICSGVPCP